jgi:adenosylhomocysteinase
MAWLNANSEMREVKPQVDIHKMKNGNEIIVLAKGRLVNLGCATGHPSFVMSNSFTNQVLAQMDLIPEPWEVPRCWSLYAAERVRRKSGSASSGANRREADHLSDKQADYLGMSKTGPFKPGHYRY